MLQKYPRAFGPGHAKREVPAVLPLEVQRLEARTAQVLVEASDRRTSCHVARSRRRKRSQRQAAGQSFQQHETERVGRLGKTKTSAAE